jgi:hypothetical protein
MDLREPSEGLPLTTLPRDMEYIFRAGKEVAP